MSFRRRNGRRFDIKNQSPTHFNLFMIRLQNSAIKSHLHYLHSKSVYYKSSVYNFLKRKNRNAVFMFWV